MLENKLSSITGPVNKPATNAQGQYVNNKLVLTAEKAGEIIDTQLIALQAISSWNHFNPATIEMQMITDLPTLVLGDEKVLKEQADSLANTKVSFKWPTGQANLSKADVQQMIEFVGSAQVNEAGVHQLVANFTPEKIRQFLLTYSAKNIDKPAVDPKLAMINNVLTVTAPAVKSR